MSFSENGLDNSSAETYLKDSTRKPANYTDTSNGELSANAPSSITIRWENGATEEEKLERIITQNISPSSPTDKRHGPSGDVPDIPAK